MATLHMFNDQHHLNPEVSDDPSATTNWEWRLQDHEEAHGEDEGKNRDYIDLYMVGSQLGEGGFGSVFAGFRIDDGVPVALKFVEKQEEDELLLPGQSVATPTEVGLMTLVNRNGGHENVLQLHEWFDEPERYVMALERPDNCMDLTKFMASQDGRLNEEMAKAVTRQLLLALLHCQKRGVFHRDVKPANILIQSDTMRVVLIDFGCGDLWRDTPYTSFAGTEAYAPPEWFSDGRYHADPATVWSVGVTVYELVCGFPLSDDHDMLDCLHMLPEGLSSEILHFIRWCLAPRAEDRFTLEELLDHEWFHSVSPTQVRTAEQELWMEDNLDCSSFCSESSDWESADGGAQTSECVWENLVSAVPPTPSSVPESSCNPLGWPGELSCRGATELGSQELQNMVAELHRLASPCQSGTMCSNKTALRQTVSYCFVGVKLRLTSSLSAAV